MHHRNLILPIIIFAQFCCTSLWFAGNGVLPQLSETFSLQPDALGHLTAAVQFGFIIGTLLFALFTIADRISPSKVFFFCAVLGALANLGMLWKGNGLLSLITFRFFTGFFLAGIYPVGMKIAADYFDAALGKSLGYLVGALVMGTAFPHLMSTFTVTLSWTWVIGGISTLSVIGGLLLLLLVPDGPYRQAALTLDLKVIQQVFQNKRFKQAAFGYFGHMWELYAFWAFVPILLNSYALRHNYDVISVSFWSFIIISIGAVGCVIAGFLSKSFGSKKIAKIALLASGLFCVTTPLLFQMNWNVFIVGMLLWGVVVIADSPMFSTLVAQNAKAEHKATALTLVNCIGFAITIVSIQLLTVLQEKLPTEFIFVFLAIGPAFGLLSLLKK